MNSKKGFALTLIVAILAVLAIGAVLFVTENEKVEAPKVEIPISTSTNPIVGGDRDIHGCIGSAGYSWCAVKNKCLRVWEEKCEVAATTTDSNCICPDNSFLRDNLCIPNCQIPAYPWGPVCDLAARECKKISVEPVACTMDAMMCPDGTYVGRSAPDCKFICPDAKPNTPASENSFCGGIAGMKCASGLTCKYDGTYPDAGGKCIKEQDDYMYQQYQLYKTFPASEQPLAYQTCYIRCAQGDYLNFKSCVEKNQCSLIN